MNQINKRFVLRHGKASDGFSYPDFVRLYAFVMEPRCLANVTHLIDSQFGNCALGSFNICS